ncbi:MAG: FAD-binding oxidoreductase [Haloquadratum sp.]|jgi:ferredoxin-NADP reductase|nr:FAD-binding oxidoreductase [Haloferacaceae archaeon]MDR9444941.1 FAD-binding oxidoreductase [Haloquadratum sp.]
METTVHSITSVGPDTVAVELATPAGFDASPGQFVKLLFEIDGETVGRFYTISSSVITERFELTIGFDPEAGGAVTERLQALDEGAPLTFEGPFGNSTYEGASEVLILAGGPGVGPAVAIAEVALAGGAEVGVVYQTADPAHRERLDALAEAGAAVWIDAAPLSEGIATVSPSPGTAQVFVFGFADLVAEATAVDMIDPSTAKIENFG